MTDHDLYQCVATLHEHLAATRELPVERNASRWLGEAEAIAGDLVGGEPSQDVLRERLGHVQALIENVDETEHTAADEHVAAAKRTTVDILDQLSDR